MTERKGWYGGAEKAETFFFEHEWEPVPGHPKEVATCNVCGLNRWSDEHAADATRVAARARKRLNELRAKLEADAEVAARLAKRYGPTMPPTAPDEPAVSGLTPREVESKAIAENSKTPQAEAPHPFMTAEFPADDGQPRCRLCGKDDPAHKQFEPEIPIAAAEGNVTITINGLAHQGLSSTTGTGTWTSNPVVYTPTLTTSTIPTANTTGSLAPILSEGQSLALPEETTKAFLTEVNGRTLLTAPANVFTRETEKALFANKHFLWMQGRFVGAEKANRNGAFWKTEDLELGELTVRHGPLNWLHEARHVIGTIANTQMVTREEAADRDLAQPYIHAASPIWRWIYPDEAWVVEQASDANKLWYSMECISERVSCVGDNSCGADVSYADYLTAAEGVCDHMTQRTATRRFANPTFLGGAVIVPPVRPGWAEADATVMQQAASLAEKAFEQAGKPDMSASEWEQLMAQVVRYAS